MGAVVVGYVPKPEGEAAVDQGIAEAKLPPMQGCHRRCQTEAQA